MKKDRNKRLLGAIDYVDDTGIWQEMYDLGYRMIMTNNYLELVKFAATKIK